MVLSMFSLWFSTFLFLFHVEVPVQKYLKPALCREAAEAKKAEEAAKEAEKARKAKEAAEAKKKAEEAAKKAEDARKAAAAVLENRTHSSETTLNRCCWLTSLKMTRNDHQR